MNFSEEHVYDALSLFAVIADSDPLLLSLHGATSIAEQLIRGAKVAIRLSYSSH